MTELIKLLKEKGLEYTKEYLNISVKEKGDLILLKYKKDADWDKREIWDCRGTILNKNTFEVISYPYSKFFNLGEKYAADMDWDSTKVYDKKDGSLINLYFYNDEWNVQTSGSFGDYKTNNPKLDFKGLFWKTIENQYGSKENFTSKLDTNNNYMFELCTPFNIVITQHEDFKTYLHGVRDMTTLEFLNIDNIDLEKVELFDLSVGDVWKKLEGMDWQEEGFVLIDKNFNRVKIKNPDYVTMSHKVGLKPSSIIEIIREQEVSEFLSYFKHMTEELTSLKELWDEEKDFIEKKYNEFNKNDNQKDFSLAVTNSDIEKHYKSIMFKLKNYNVDVHTAMATVGVSNDKINKYWYYKFKKKLKW